VYQIQNLTGDSRQKQTLVLPDQTFIEMEIYFVPMQLGWFITELTYQSFVLNGLRITNQPNLLYQFRNKLPFGLACFSSAQREPSQQEDFLSGASKLYILTEAEVEAYTEFLTRG
jgi:hypothetical protein